MKRRCREPAVVVAGDAVLPADESQVVAVFVKAVGKAGVGGEEERLLQQLLAPERVADHHADILHAGDAGDVRDVERTRLNLPLRNHVSVEADDDGRRQCDFGRERRGRVLHEIRVHRVILGEADAAHWNRAGQVERRREEIADGQAAQIRVVVVLRVGDEPREAIPRTAFAPDLVGGVVKEPVSGARSELGRELVAALTERVISRRVESVVEEEAVLGRIDDGRSPPGREVERGAGKRTCRHLDVQRHRRSIELHLQAGQRRHVDEGVAFHVDRLRAGMRQSPSGKFG